MKLHWIPFQDIPQLSYKDKSYTNELAALRPFYKYPVSIEAFEQVIADKSKANINRNTLVTVLQEQYADLDMTDKVNQNIQALVNQNTFTLITAHQPSLFTGPLYYIYKILSCINLSQQLNKKYPNNHFVPVFVTGGEDHDFEEVNYINLFNKKVVWENDQKGSVGMMSTKSLQPTLNQLKEILGESEKAKEIFEIIEKAYTQNELYSKATVQLTHELFKAYGLVVLNMNHPKLKQQFIPYIKKEILERPSKQLVENTSQELEKEANFKQQAFPRPINFFFLKEGLRERIVYENEQYKVLNTNYVFTEEEIAKEIEEHPEYFSPNVIMRPLYQEVVMPNLAYIGGGGELAYWLERKAQFEHFGVNFPMLIRRNSVLWLDKGTTKKINKLDLSIAQMFQKGDALTRLFVSNQSTVSLDINSEKESVGAAYDSFAEKAKAIDPTLAKTILAEKAKQLKSLGQLEGRLLRAEKQKHETSLQQIAGLKERLFPKNGLQERTDNFLSLYLKYGRAFFDVLLEQLDPLQKKFLVVEDAVN